MSNYEIDVKRQRHTDQYSALFNAPVAVVSERKWPVALQTMQIVPAAEVYPISCPKPLIQKHTNVEIIATKKQLPVRFLGYSPIFSETRIYQGPESDWALMNLADDPLYYSNGQRLIVPSVVAQDINSIVKAGIDFSTIYIAHEIPKGSIKQGEEIPLELIAPPPPPDVVRRVKKRSRGAETFWQKVMAAIQVMITTGAATTIGAASFVGALVAFDPVLFGVLVDEEWQVNGKPIGLWYYITHWYWPIAEE